jgi:Tfp pilus assembly protein PilF
MMPSSARVHCPLFAAVLRLLLSAFLSLQLTGCASSPRSTGQTIDRTVADNARAAQLAEEAGRYLVSDPVRAHRLLQDALEVDAFCGTAHNNLGVLHLAGTLPDQGVDLFKAAESFQLAAKLLPGRPDPRMNLGLVLERAGRLDDARSAYLTALDADPRHMPSIEALASLEIRSGESSPETIERLKIIALEGSSPAWREWARERLLRTGK